MHLAIYMDLWSFPSPINYWILLQHFPLHMQITLQFMNIDHPSIISPERRAQFSFPFSLTVAMFHASPATILRPASRSAYTSQLLFTPSFSVQYAHK